MKTKDLTKVTHVANEQKESGLNNVYAGLSYDELLQIENSLQNNYKIQSNSIKSKLAIYNKSLENTLNQLQMLYNNNGRIFDGTVNVNIKENVDTLVKLTNVTVNQLFDIKFVSGLYEKFTFSTADGVQTLKAVKRKVSNKTDFSVLSERVTKVLGFNLEIEKTVFTEKENQYYWYPILNFSVVNVLKTVFAINKDSIFKIQKAVIKAEMKKAKNKSKKAEKKAKKAEQAESK